jgi:histidyl-tRNA synthetase
MFGTQKIVYQNPNEFLKKATAVASYYGFLPVQKMLDEAKKEKRPQVPCTVENGARGADALGGTLTNTMKSCVQWNVASKERGPALVFSTNAHDASKSQKRTVFGLHMIGTPKSIAEAMILRTALAILEDLEVQNTIVQINSLGDRDSMARFSRELSNFFRKHAADLPTPVRELAFKEPFEALTLLLDKKHPLFDLAPHSIDFLSEASRRHFREVVEFIEHLGVPYEINERIIGNKNCYSQTLFEIHGSYKGGEMMPVARGGRYDEFGKRLLKAGMPGVGLVLAADMAPNASMLPKVSTPRPKVFFVQLGFEARLKSFGIVETLRRAHIPLRQSLGTESLTEQLVLAERMRIPYSVIMGYKEALEDAVIVRHMETRAQDTVPIPALTTHLKKVLLR